MSSSEFDLEIRHLSKRYSKEMVVSDMNFTIRKGEFLTLLGPSGSGKTTLLMMIAGFVEPTTGSIVMSGREITQMPPEKRRFGMVFQGYALFPHMNVFDNVAYPLRVRRTDKASIREKTMAALEQVQLSDYAARMPKALSGGQQQRVALARALSFWPSLLLLDEPLGALDKKLRADVQEELKDLHRKLGMTFIYVTHDQEEALSMSDRIAVMRAGKLEQIGMPHELYERPANKFVADFLGKSNFLHGEVASSVSGRLTYRINGTLFEQARDEGVVHRVGDPVLVALRPEKIMIDWRQSASEDRGNRIEGRLQSWSYFGAHLHLSVQAGNMEPIIVHAPAWGSPSDLAQGQPIWLSWEPEASVIIAE